MHTYCLDHIHIGVRYASPPVGKLRFMPPVTSSHWTGVKNALSPGPICPQKISTDDNGNLTSSSSENRHHASLRADSLRGKLRSQAKLQNQSEDCLYLNIYAPAIGRWSCYVRLASCFNALKLILVVALPKP